MLWKYIKKDNKKPAVQVETGESTPKFDPGCRYELTYNKEDVEIDVEKCVLNIHYDKNKIFRKEFETKVSDNRCHLDFGFLDLYRSKKEYLCVSEYIEITQRGNTVRLAINDRFAQSLDLDETQIKMSDADKCQVLFETL